LCLGLSPDVQALSDALYAHPETPTPVGEAGVDVIVGFEGACAQ